MQRRKFMKNAALVASAGILVPEFLACNSAKGAADPATGKRMFFDISLAEWSLHRALFGGKMTNLDFPGIAKKDYGISAIEYVNQFFKDKAKDKKYLADLKMRCDDNGVKSVLIMCDGEGYLGEIMVHRLTHVIGVVENVIEGKAGWPPQITLKLKDGSAKKGRLMDFREPSGGEREKYSAT